MTCAMACQACDECWAEIVRTGRVVPTVAEKRAEIESRLHKAQAELLALQSECEHAFATYENRASVGNYDPSMDCYWRNHHCADCGKHWTEEQ